MLDKKPDQLLLFGQHQHPTLAKPCLYASLKSMLLERIYNHTSKSSQSIIGEITSCFLIFESLESLSYLLLDFDSFLRIPWKVRIRFSSLKVDSIFLVIAPVLKIVQHQRITLLGGPITSQRLLKS